MFANKEGPPAKAELNQGRELDVRMSVVAPAASTEAKRLLGHVTVLQKLPCNSLQARPAPPLATVQ